MAEQTHSKQVAAEEKYLVELRESEAYKLLRFAFLNGLLHDDHWFTKVVSHFLDTGRIESGIYERDYILNGR